MANAEYTVTTKDGAEFTITAPEGTPSEEISKRARAVIEGTAQTPAEQASGGIAQGAGEFAKGLGVGAAKAAEAFPGAMASTLGLVGRGAEYLGLGDPAEAAKREQFRAENKPPMLTGGLHAPESLPGKYGETIGEFLPVTMAGPGSLLRRIGTAIFGGGASETAGQGAKRGKIGELFVGSDASGAKKEKANQIAESAARLLGALTPATLELLWRHNPDRMLQVVNDLENAARQNYNSPAVRNVQIRTNHVQAEAIRIHDDLYADGMRPTTAPGTAGALNDMLFVPPPPSARRIQPIRTHVNIDDIQSIRQNLRDVAGNFNNPVDQRWAGRALDRIDDFLAQLPQNALLRGNAQQATAQLVEARGNWWAARSLDALGEKLYSAELQTASAHSGTNFDNPVRQRVRSILISPKQRARYTDEEIGLMERIVEGTASQNLMRRLNKLFPRSGVMGAALHGSSIMALGPAGVIPAIAGETAAAVENRLANRLVRDLQRSILERSPAGQAGTVQLPPRADIPNFATPAAAGSLSGYLQERRETPALPALEKRSSLNPDEGRVVSDVDTRPIAGQQYAMMNEDDLRNPGQRRPLATPMFGGPGAGPSKPVNQLPPVQPRPANQNVKAPRASNENALSAGSHQRPIPEQYKEPKSFLQRISDNTKDMNRSEILQSEPLWGGARQLSESGKMSFRDAFHMLTEQITGYGLTPQEWAKIADQAMKYGIR